jgi:hypothetical protein
MTFGTCQIRIHPVVIGVPQPIGGNDRCRTSSTVGDALRNTDGGTVSHGIFTELPQMCSITRTKSTPLTRRDPQLTRDARRGPALFTGSLSWTWLGPPVSHCRTKPRPADASAAHVAPNLRLGAPARRCKKSCLANTSRASSWPPCTPPQPVSAWSTCGTAADVASPRRTHSQVSFDLDLISDDEASW